MSFNHLHLHTNLGSRLDGIASSADYAKRAVELGHTSVAITDHGKLTGWYEHQVACKKYGVKPIFGLEQYVCSDDTLEAYDAKKKRIRPQNNHLVLLAKNEAGYKNLMKLHYISMADEKHFYYNNHSSFEEIFEHKEGLIVGTACLGSPFANLIKKGKLDQAEALLDRFHSEFGDDMYAELQINELFGEIEGLSQGQKTVNNFIKDWANKNGVLIVLTGDVHYLDKEDYIVQNIALAMQSKKTINDVGAFQLEGQTLFYHDIEDYKFFNKNWGYGYTDEEIETWCNNTQIIADKCNYYIPERDRMILPEVFDDDEEEMERLSKEGLAKYFSVSKYEDCPEDYRKRLERELEVLKRKGFGSYAMILYDIFEFCKREDIMRGPARGCFLPDQYITLSNGNYKKISCVEEGDKIITGFGIESKVKRVFSYDINEVVQDTVLENGEVIKSTTDHMILVIPENKELVMNNAVWRKAKDIKNGDFLIKDL